MKKLHIQQKYPQVFDFLLAVIEEESGEVKEMITQKVDPIYEKSTKKMYDQIDYSKFREGLDVEKAIEILNWTMFGFGEKGLKEINTFENIREFGEQYLREWESYSKILKDSFYK